jgi:hypothetical protein
VTRRNGETTPVVILDPGCPTCQTGPSRETVDMVCQTCGTDYAPDARRDDEATTAFEDVR